MCAQAFYQGGSPSNYTIGGTRFWFNRLVDDTVSPARYEGFVDMGNVVDSSLEQEIEEQDHFSSKTGTRRKDRSLVKEISEEGVFTLDELSTENLRAFFRGGDVTDQPAQPADPADWQASTAYVLGDWVAATTPAGFNFICTTAGTTDASEPTWPTAEGGTVTDGTVVWTAYPANVVADEVMQLERTDVKILQLGYLAEDIVVKDITGVTTHVKDTDYTEVTISPGNYIGIKRIEGGGIADGDFVRVGYNYASRVRRKFYPATNLEVKGKALFFGVSDTGNEFARQFRNAQLEPEGAFSMNDDDWSNMQLRLKILDDSDTVSTAPFGLFYHYGTGSDL